MSSKRKTGQDSDVSQSNVKKLKENGEDDAATDGSTAANAAPAVKIRQEAPTSASALLNPYSRDNPPLQSQLFVPPRTKNRGNFLCVRLIAPPPDPDKLEDYSSPDRKRMFTSDIAMGAWCTVCCDTVWWRKGESNGISRHMTRIHPDLLRRGTWVVQ